MIQFDHTKYLPSFLHTAEALSFSQAARTMGVTPAAVSKAVKALEGQLNCRLFHRSTHSLALTEEGERFYQEIKPIAQAMANTFESIQAMNSTARGTLRVTAPVELGHNYLLPLLPSFNLAYPDIKLELNFDDRPIDLVKEGYDIGIGNRAGDDSLLIARKLFDINIILVASPSFVKQYGPFNEPEALGDVPCIGYQRDSRCDPAPWRVNVPDGETKFVKPDNTVVIVNTVQALCELASLGVGIAPVATWSAQRYIDRGDLIQVLPQVFTSLAPARIYYTSREHQPAKVRAFVDFITEQLRVE
ncbi:LysR family transcriptional regulator [Salinibius halmophilus]|uniref:LysR family transcriptional regulator n=1 Tax=Salinibius halmophilus TaxID=1853216 RepID=UPI0013140038|nr:LysR family transcriptional regulator [Salinibius halmophilus]